MRTRFNGLSICVGIALLLAGGATAAEAQTASVQDAPPPAEALPPPSMDDPGMAAPAPTPATSGKPAKKKKAAAAPALPAESATVGSIPLASASMSPEVGELTSTDPTPPKPSLTHSASNSSKPLAGDSLLSGDGMTVSIRTMDNGDRIEEYRSGGQLMRVKVTPRKAPPYEIIDTNGDGRVDGHDKNSQKTVGWALFKWH